MPKLRNKFPFGVHSSNWAQNVPEGIVPNQKVGPKGAHSEFWRRTKRPEIVGHLYDLKNWPLTQGKLHIAKMPTPLFSSSFSCQTFVTRSKKRWGSGSSSRRFLGDLGPGSLGRSTWGEGGCVGRPFEPEIQPKCS